MKKISNFFFSFFFCFIFSMINKFFFMMYFNMENMMFIMEWEMISLISTNIVLTISLDSMSLLFMKFVLLISSSVIYNSKSYMSSEMNLNRFIILVIMFVLSMIFLIISPNIISILLGWDGLGLISYCLVIYYQNIKSYNAGMLTALSNGIGDVMILMVIAWMMNYGSWNIIFYLSFMKNDFFMNFIGVMVIIAAMTKRAQIPFSSWFPAAMAAPTPVSSSSFFNIGNCSSLFINPLFLVFSYIFIKNFIILFGMTIINSGNWAKLEMGLKKIIALSTLSQLGLMMSIVSMGYGKLAFFHLLTHAMFKALLFMCAGVIIHVMNDNQDIRMMGGVSIYMPMTSLCMNISNMALCGIPFLAGFYSKDMILETVMMSNLNMLVLYLYYFSTGLTMFYTIRLMMYLMINDFNLMSIYNMYDEDYVMLKSMMILLMMSLISGSMLSWMIFYYPYMIYMSLNMKLMVIYVSLMGGFMGWMISLMNIYSMNKFLMFYNLNMFFTLMWFMPSLSVYGLNYKILNFSKNLYKNIDMGWSEMFSGQGMVELMKNYSLISSIYQMNNFKIYLFSFVFWMMLNIMLLILI
uniref:NADH-ubiquinone oxidoreductase chain 5 n=1 Tax=Tirumala limniace TaxID=551222 RepID=A0A0A7HF03_TIRLI|nr:NADH dehydrogenase subunit 5 [Tirumala limniace]